MIIVTTLWSAIAGPSHGAGTSAGIRFWTTTPEPAHDRVDAEPVERELEELAERQALGRARAGVLVDDRPAIAGRSTAASTAIGPLPRPRCGAPCARWDAGVNRL